MIDSSHAAWAQPISRGKPPPGAAAPWTVVGVGSPHGDDQAGWLLARAVVEALQLAAGPRLLQTPSDLLLDDPLSGQLMLCDGLRSGASPGTVRLLAWPNAQIAQGRFSGSHDLGLPQVLALLERLGRLPPCVWLWTVEIGGAMPLEGVSPAVRAGILPAAIRALAARGPEPGR